MKSHMVSGAEYEFTSPTQNPVKRKDRIESKGCSAMSTKTKDFIQKICYKQTASIDMTKYGFINDSKINPINLMIKPLRAQLEKICVKVVRKSSSLSTSSHTVPSSSRSNILKSALSHPRKKCNSHQLGAQNEAKPTVTKKKVTLIVPSKEAKKKIAVK